MENFISPLHLIYKNKIQVENCVASALGDLDKEKGEYNAVLTQRFAMVDKKRYICFVEWVIDTPLGKRALAFSPVIRYNCIKVLEDWDTPIGHNVEKFIISESPAEVFINKDGKKTFNIVRAGAIYGSYMDGEVNKI